MSSAADTCSCGSGLDPFACGCCGTPGAEPPRTPLLVENRPGLSAIAYRVGTQPLFKRSMLKRLSDIAGIPVLQPLTGLRTRSDNDFSIALLDAWATAADVMTFYQERLANESYLATATELRSLLELARLVGYEPRPGVAASTYLSFTLEQEPKINLPGVPGLPRFTSIVLPVNGTPGVPHACPVPAGTRVQSVPGPGESPQTFETVEDIEARADWNAMVPRLFRPHPNDSHLGRLVLDGLDSNLKIGDYVLLMVGTSSDRVLNRVTDVKLDIPTQSTRVTLENGHNPDPTDPSTVPATTPSGPLALDDATVQSLVAGQDWDQDDLLTLVAARKWDERELQDVINQVTSQAEKTDLLAFAFRSRAAVFGHNAQYWPALDAAFTAQGATNPWSNWEGNTLFDDSGNQGRVWLDSSYPAVVAGSWIALKAVLYQFPTVASLGAVTLAKAATKHAPFKTVEVGVSVTKKFLEEVEKLKVAQVSAVHEFSRADYAISAKATRVTLDNAEHLDDFHIRRTAVLCQSEPLRLGGVPKGDLVQGASVLLSKAYLGLKPGQRVAVTGVRADSAGVTASEVVTLSDVHLVNGYTRLDFVTSLEHPYLADTVTLNANVAPATHGESRQEVLGSGDAGQVFQTFTLRQPPLTYVPAATPAGNASTLVVRVNDVAWQEVDHLYGRGPDERVFVTTPRDDGSRDVSFGDGVNGALLPTGPANVTATYRRGIGRAGSVAAGELSLLLTRPLGVKTVTNPVAAAGGDDPENTSAIRPNLPLSVRTLGRVVSLQDYEDFARAFVGVAKAQATWTCCRSCSARCSCVPIA